MRNLLNPQWLFIVNSLPVAALFLLYYGQFSIIKSLLNEESITLWKSFAVALGTLGLLNFGYSTYLTIKRQNVSIFYSLIALVAHIIFIYLYGMHLHKIVPASIPRWMIPGSLFLYAGTFLMPTLAYALFVLVLHCTPNTKKHNASLNFLFATLVPISWYLFVQIILPLWQKVGGGFEDHVLMVLVIAGTLMFFFFLVRSAYILFFKKSEQYNLHPLIWKIPICILFPIAGLLLNDEFFGGGTRGVFGNFSNIWFYILAALNGLLLCMPNIENQRYRLGLFLGRSITFAYTLYFFLVFLPYLPLSVIAILIVGTGFLMLTPLVLIMIHIKEWISDFSWLKKYYPTSLISILSLTAFLFIPTIITSNYLKDRNTLHTTLDYLYQPDYSKSYQINTSSLQKTIEMVKEHKRSDRRFFIGSQLPYLSTFFNWLVLDNLTLSNKKITAIEKIFFGDSNSKRTAQLFNSKDDVQISKVTTNSTYDATQNAWRSWIDLEITNFENRDFQEYVTTFELPEGAWISDYYLYVGDRKEMGILSEKKTAMWVYSNITSRSRDPGILYYLSGNRVAFRVYPFVNKEVRKTGIEILHKAPIEITIDDKQIKLGEKSDSQKLDFENDHLLYITAAQKQNLKQVFRKPYFHFVMDCTRRENIPSLNSRIEKIIAQYPNLVENASISFANSYVTTHPFSADWKQQLEKQKFEGGFYLDRAIKTILFEAHQHKTASYPIIVVVTDYIEEAVFERDFSDWQFTFPESDVFYNLKYDSTVEAHSLTSKPSQPVEKNTSISFNHPVLEYPLKNKTITYLPDNNEASLILKEAVLENTKQDFKTNNWESAAVMQANWIKHILHPEKTDKNWLSLVKQSFQTQVMSPVTSYLAVENEAQKAMLKKKQAQVLASNPSLDLGDEVQEMSEPGLLLLSILLLLFLWLRNKRFGLVERRINFKMTF